MERGRGKSLAAVKQEKNSLARAKIAGRESSYNGARYLLQLGLAFLFPTLSIATSLFYILFVKIDSSCYRMLRYISPAVKKNHWTCPLYPALTDCQRTANAILQCHPHLKALGSELTLSRKINKNTGLKLLVDSFAPLA